jgi:hypothetical protein
VSLFCHQQPRAAQKTLTLWLDESTITQKEKRRNRTYPGSTNSLNAAVFSHQEELVKAIVLNLESVSPLTGNSNSIGAQKTVNFSPQGNVAHLTQKKRQSTTYFHHRTQNSSASFITSQNIATVKIVNFSMESPYTTILSHEVTYCPLSATLTSRPALPP